MTDEYVTGTRGIDPVSIDPGAAREVTVLLVAWQAGDKTAAEPLFERVYPVLRRMARRQLRSHGSATVQATEIVHEAYLKMAEAGSLHWDNRVHFFGFSARLIRQVLVDRARRRNAIKRGSGMAAVELETGHGEQAAPSMDLLALDESLARLAEIDVEASRVVELRYFGGLTIPEIATFLGIATATVSRRWGMARGWLHRALTERAPGDP